MDQQFLGLISFFRDLKFFIVTAVAGLQKDDIRSIDGDGQKVQQEAFQTYFSKALQKLVEQDFTLVQNDCPN